MNETNISNEIIYINISRLFGNFSRSSVNVIGSDGSLIPYEESEGNIKILIPFLSVNEISLYLIRFDDVGNFTQNTVNITGSDILKETVLPVDEISIIDYHKLEKIKNMEKENLEAEFGMKGFHFTIYDFISQASVEFGWNVPPRGNIVSLQRYVMMQNSTGSLRPGMMVVRKWTE